MNTDKTSPSSYGCSSVWPNLLFAKLGSGLFLAALEIVGDFRRAEHKLDAPRPCRLWMTIAIQLGHNPPKVIWAAKRAPLAPLAGPQAALPAKRCVSEPAL